MTVPVKPVTMREVTSCSLVGLPMFHRDILPNLHGTRNDPSGAESWGGGL